MARQRKHPSTYQHSLYAIQGGTNIRRDNIILTNYHSEDTGLYQVQVKLKIQNNHQQPPILT